MAAMPPIVAGYRRSVSSGDPNGTAQPGAADAAVPARVLGQVLLMVGLGVVEGPGGGDLGGDGPVAAGGEHRLERVSRRLGRLPLQLGVGVGRRPVLRAVV